MQNQLILKRHEIQTFDSQSSRMSVVNETPHMLITYFLNTAVPEY